MQVAVAERPAKTVVGHTFVSKTFSLLRSSMVGC